MQAFSPRSAPSQRTRLVLITLLAVLSPPAAGASAHAAENLPTARAVRRLLAHPPREYATAPLWVWNDWLSERQIRDTLRDLAGQQVKQVFVHPRPGLMTPYLGPEWFRLWKVALDEAARLDMNVWIYDENSYPSGFAGGWVPELMPESRGQGLALRVVESAPGWTADTVALYRIEGERAENVSTRAKAGEALPAGRYLVAMLQQAGNSPWHGGRSYVNLLTPGVTEQFIEVTLEAYRREVGSQFGQRIPGVFTDEPNIRPAGGFPWCPDLPEQFQQRWGYDLLDHLPCLTLEVGDWRRVRHNYYSTLNALFIERWAKPMYDWCERHGLAFTGHYWDHEWPHCLGVPDNMAMAAWQHIPGIDCLMNQYAEHTHAQFGNVRFCREVASLANQLGRPRVLCEIFGAGGWDLRFEDMKRIGDWLVVLGVNLLDEHLSYLTIRGARKRDHPQSFSYHEPWWEAYHQNARYFTRLSAVMSQGQQINRILVLEPTTTAWMYQGHEPKLRELGDTFFKLLMDLEAAQIEYDLGCEDVLARHGAVVGPRLRVGRRFYDVVVLPPHTENISAALLHLGETFLEMGGQVLCLGEPPARVDGAPSGRPAEGAGEPGWIAARPEQAAAMLERLAPAEGFRLRRAPGDRGILFHHRRHLADGQVLLLVNTSLEAPSAGTLESDLRGVERWDPYTGATEPYPFEKTPTGLQAAFQLPPSGSLLLFLSRQPLKPAPLRPETSTPLAPTGPMEIRRLEPNVLTLDYVDLTAGGETRSNLYFYAANRLVWQKHGLDRNPWDSAVQFKDELVSRRFPADSGFTASYRFTLEGAVPPNLAIVIERPDLYTVTCNGRPVSAATSPTAADVAPRTPPRSAEAKSSAPPGVPQVEFKAWWLDKAFGRIPLAGAARPGENVVTLEARPFTMFHELEPAYVLGDFTLQPAARGWVLAADRPLAPGRWNEQGHPFYAHGVAYRQRFQVPDRRGRFVVGLPAWYGSVARVEVNGKRAGYIVAPPWELEVTKLVKRGDNRIEVVVFGTLKNTLGPHHGTPGLGSAWPGMFQNSPPDGPPPGPQYSTVGYGLFAPFTLRQIQPTATAAR